MKHFMKYALATMLLLMAQACSTSSSEDPLATAQTNLVRTWRTSNVTINNLPLAALGAAVPGLDVAAIRLTFRADGTFQAVNLGALSGALPATGTWAFANNDVNRIVINPGNLAVELSNLTPATGTLTLQYVTTGTPLAVLGNPATIKVDMIPG
jgi:hypothetical protein